MNPNFLPFEKPIIELERKIEELRKFSQNENIDVSVEIQSLEKKSLEIKKEIYKKLSAWQRIQIARHPNRPYTLDYIKLLMDDFTEIHGDRTFADDQALIGGLAKIDGQKIMIIGHQKGRDTKESLKRNFGCAHPEGYRKALRLMKMANKFNIPIITFVDTPGAYPGVGAEERGQAEAIAVNLREMMMLEVPIIVIVIGEGGSGGALGIGVGNKVLILEHAYYSVISPEGCAAILWKSGEKTEEAAAALKLTGTDLIKLKIVETIIPEPLGGAHRDPKTTAENIKNAILDNLKELSALSKEELLEQRYRRFRQIGFFTDTTGTDPEIAESENTEEEIKEKTEKTLN